MHLACENIIQESMTYPDSVRFLYALGNEIKSAKLGLERMTILARALGSPQNACKFVHVAGTNGKGSTCAMLESSLRASGLRTGLFTSPHLVEPTERIRINGVDVSAEIFSAAFREVHETAEHLLADGTLDMHPTYFETVTLMAFLIFKRAQVDIVVLEVGLGGRLDATNIVTPVLSVITPVDFDHESFLGKSLDSIAGEKAGIIKAGIPVIISEQRPEAAQVIARQAREMNAPLQVVSMAEVEQLHFHRDGSSFRWRDLSIVCNLAGEHQAQNALTAAAALRAIGIQDQSIVEGIRNARWPGRLERVRTNPDFYLDGAHNPAGARALSAYIKRFHAGRRISLIYGAMRDKSVEEIAAILFPLADEVLLVAPAQPRAVRPQALLAMSDHSSMRTESSLAEAIAATRGEVTFLTGSLYLVGEARPLLVQ
jgi:dihydrofolate synthase/folylpolyglutamate synthase